MIALISSFDENLIDYDADSMIQLTRMFSDEQQMANLLVIKSTPNLRHHLQNAGLTGISIWNVFDYIQDIHITESIPYGVEDLVFPNGAQPSYRGDAVRYYLNGQLYATVRLHGEGYVWSVEYQVQNEKQLTEYYDDRGFLSTRVWQFEDESLSHQEWYNFDGDLMMQQEANGEILVSANLRVKLGRANFDNLTQVIAQITNTYLQTKGIDTIVGNLTDDLAELRVQLDQVKKTIFLISSNQVSLTSLKWVQASDLLVVPTKKDRELFNQALTVDKSIDKLQRQVLAIPTQATQLSLGSSNEIPLMEINWLTSDAPSSFIDQAYTKMMTIIAHDEDKSLRVYVQNDEEIARLQAILEAWITAEFAVDLRSKDFLDLKKYLQAKEKERVTVDMENMMKERKKLPSWKPMVDAYMMLKRVYHELEPSFAGMAQQLRRARIFIDSGSKPITASQILAISAGIPQINRIESDYLVADKNGKIVTNENELVAAVSYYLDTLSNWNKVVVFNAQMIEDNSADKIYSRWQEVL